MRFRGGLFFVMLLLVWLIAPPRGWGQEAAKVASAGVSPVLDRYSAEAAVVERWETVYRYNANGTGTKETTVAIRLQSDAALRQFGVVSLPFASGTEHMELDYVRVRRPDGGVAETPVTDAMEIPAEVTRQAPFYSDLKQMQIPVRSLRVGDVLEYRAREVQTKADAPDAFWGQERMADELVVLSQVLELRVPKTKQVTVWSPRNKPEVTEDGAERVYRWRGSHLEPTAGKEADARREADKGKILPEEDAVDAREGKLPTVAWTTFPSWEAVGAWYQGLEADRAVADAEVKAKTRELTAGKQTEEEKARAIYGYVSSQIRYIGVAFGVGRYQPHTAGEVAEPIRRLQGQAHAAGDDAEGSGASAKCGADWRGASLQRGSSFPWRLQSPDYDSAGGFWDGVAGCDTGGGTIPDAAVCAARPERAGSTGYRDRTHRADAGCSALRGERRVPISGDAGQGGYGALADHD